MYRRARRVIDDSDSDSDHDSASGSDTDSGTAVTVKLIDTTANEFGKNFAKTPQNDSDNTQRDSREPEDISRLLDGIEVLEIDDDSSDDASPSEDTRDTKNKTVGAVDSLKSQFTKYAEGQAVPLTSFKSIPSHVRGYVSQDLALNSSQKKSSAPLRQTTGNSKTGMLTRSTLSAAASHQNKQPANNKSHDKSNSRKGSSASSDAPDTIEANLSNATPSSTKTAPRTATPIGVPFVPVSEYTSNYRMQVNERYRVFEEESFLMRPQFIPQKQPSSSRRDNFISRSAGLTQPGKDDILNMIDRLQELNLANLSKADTPKNMSITLREHQQIGVAWMIKNECNKSTHGGILGDDMGLGKTVETLALMMSRLPRTGQTHGTLIITPVSVASHWKQEIESKITPGLLKVLIYHGADRSRYANALKQYDVVISTYGTVSSEWQNVDNIRFVGMSEEERSQRDMDIMNSSSGPLFKNIWRRIILDEAHQIKNHSSKISRACHDLVGRYRWCLTGTPLQNTLDDIFPQLRFLRIKPYWHHDAFRTLIQNSHAGDSHLRAVLADIMLRRSKTSTLGDKPLLALPARHLHVHRISLSRAELFFYDTMAAIALLYEKLDNEGEAVNLNADRSMPAMFVSLLRMRQASSHPRVAGSIYDWRVKIQEIHKGESRCRDSKALNGLRVNRFARNLDPETLTEIKCLTDINSADELESCVKCRQRPTSTTDLYIHTCGVLICWGCCTGLSQKAKPAACPGCKQAITPTTIIEFNGIACAFAEGTIREQAQWDGISGYVPESDMDEDGTDRLLLENGDYLDEYDDRAPLSVVSQQIDWVAKTLFSKNSNNEYAPSSKMRKILSILQWMRQTGPADKCVIISEHLEMISLLSAYLNGEGFKSLVYTGDMSMDHRKAAIESFSTDPQYSVLLVSKKAGATGINLVAANHVILESLWWNPAIDNQAVDRVYRIGQTKEVHVHVLVAKHSIDEKMLMLQESKRKMIDSVIGDGSDGSHAKLTREDILNIIRTL